MDVKELRDKPLKSDIDLRNRTLDAVACMIEVVNDRRPEITITELIDMIKALKCGT
jgi:hypothetical protein